MQYDENAEKYGYEGEMTPIECDKFQAYKADVTIPVYGTIADAQVYLKSEADKVIADKDKEIAEQESYIAELERRIADGGKDFEMADHQNERLLKSVRRNKYKRCLAMAGRCRLRGRLFGACGLYEKELWALKWHKRWLELAEKFKEANDA